MKIGVYVGSFNPVHKGHIKVANFLLENNYVDKVLILPTPNYWDKQDLIDIKQRVEMLKFYETDKIIIDDIHNNYEYTCQVLNSLKKDYKDDDLYLIMGSDNIENFHLWKNVDQILKNKVIVLRRGNNDIYKYIEKFDKTKFTVIDNFNYLNISSTEIRNGNLSFIDKKVCDYIKENNLYFD